MARQTLKLTDSAGATRYVRDGAVTLPFASSVDGNGAILYDVPISSGVGRLTYSDSAWRMSADSGATYVALSDGTLLSNGAARLALQGGVWQASYDSGATWAALGGGGVPSGMTGLAVTHSSTPAALFAYASDIAAFKAPLQFAATICASIGGGGNLCGAYAGEYGLWWVEALSGSAPTLNRLNRFQEDVYTIASTRVIPADTTLELAIQATATHTTFYLDGVPETPQEFTWSFASMTGNSAIVLYSFFVGYAGRVQIGSGQHWPTDRNKGVLPIGAAFPGAVFSAALHEGAGASVTDTVNSVSATLDANTTWTILPVSS